MVHYRRLGAREQEQRENEVYNVFVFFTFLPNVFVCKRVRLCVFAGGGYLLQFTDILNMSTTFP